MKVAVFGGGGLRTPLLLSALDRSGPGFREAALYDPDGERLAALLPVLRAAAPGLAVTRAGSPAEAARGSRFVVLAIRVGGQEARAADERACLEAGAVGQETVGAAGAALAFRNLPAALDLARTVEREAPDALVVNYANPAGMVTEALANRTGARVVGVCDTPAALADRVAGLVGAAPGRFSVSWSGVNHLGWLTRLYAPPDCSARCPAHLSAPSPDDPASPAGRPVGRPLRRTGTAPVGASARAVRGGGIPGGGPVRVCVLRAPPRPGRSSGRARRGPPAGRQVLELEARLFAALRAPAGASAGTDEEAGLRVYREVLAEREATYFGIEAGGGSTGAGTAGGAAKPGPGGGAGLAPSGYDRIGLAVIRAALAAEDDGGGRRPGQRPGQRRRDRPEHAQPDGGRQPRRAGTPGGGLRRSPGAGGLGRGGSQPAAAPPGRGRTPTAPGEVLRAGNHGGGGRRECGAGGGGAPGTPGGRPGGGGGLLFPEAPVTTGRGRGADASRLPFGAAPIGAPRGMTQTRSTETG